MTVNLSIPLLWLSAAQSGWNEFINATMLQPVAYVVHAQFNKIVRQHAYIQRNSMISELKC